MITTVVRQYNRVVMGASIGICRSALSVLVRGDKVALSRADCQFDALQEFVERHPLRVNNPLFFLDAVMVSELQDDINAARDAWQEAYDAKRKERYEALRERILANREHAARVFMQTGQMSRVTTLPFCTDGVGDTAS